MTKAALLLLLLPAGAFGAEKHIMNASDLIEFANNVNNGSTYSGTTVVLDSDVDFTDELSQQFEPIGNTSENYFRGVFDGQGHTISNLAISSSSQYVGLFGYSEGLTVNSVVLDGTCSITSTFNSSSIAGSVVGRCSFCTIRNTVNMGSVAFDGSTDSLYIGGISGAFSSGAIRNSVNYGSVTHSGISAGSYCELGGIVGYSFGDELSTNNSTNIQNCANYGTLAITGASSPASYLYVGGILGDSWSGSATVDNCVSAGRIVLNKSSKYIGSIVGYANPYSTTAITHCLWTSDVGHNTVYGYVSLHASTAYTDSSLTTLDSAALAAMNSYAEKDSEWDSWLMLHLGEGRIINFNQETLIVTQKYFPDPIKKGHSFSGWFVEPECTEEFDPNSDNATNLYAQFQLNNYTVTFHFGDGTVETRSVAYGAKYGDLPSPEERTGYTFEGWFTAEEGGDKIDQSTHMTIESNHAIYAHWTANKYTVTFHANGGSALSFESKEVTFDQEYGDLPSTTMTGYTFYGWFTNNTGGIEVESTTTMNKTEDHTLYAHWTVNNYTVTFEARGGTHPHSIKVVTFDKDYGDLPSTTRTGYTFNGWFTEETGGTKIEPATKVSIAEDHTLYAHWTANKYTIAFDKNEYSTEKQTKEVTYDDFYGEFPMPEGWDGYDWWYTQKTGGSKIEPSDKVNITENITLYAQKKKNSYIMIVAFNAIGGISTQAARMVWYQEKYGELPGAKKTGYTFDGWYIEGNTKVDSSTTVNTNHILYAHWTVNTYTVTFDANGGSLPSSQSSKEVTFDQNYGELPSTTRTGYAFDGWFTEKAGGDAIESTTTMKIAEDHTLYARWTANKYNLTLIENGNSLQQSKEVTYDSTYGELPEPTRTGYTFIGWFTETEGGGEKIEPNTLVNVTEDQTLYACWEINNYTVTFDVNGGEELPIQSKSIPYNNYYGDLPEPNRTGYTFYGWFTDKTEGDAIESTTKMNMTEDHTLYAHWTANNYNVTYNTNGGITTEKTTKEVTYDGIYGDPLNPTRNGYGLDGWFTEVVKGTRIGPNTKVAITKDQVLYAHWKLGAFTVTFNAMGGTSTQASKAVIIDSEYGDLPDATKTGYTFVGWYTEIEGGSEVKKETLMKNRNDHTLYAHWTANNYTVTFDARGGTPPESTKVVTFDKDYGDLPDANRTGYTFNGWFTNATGGTKIEPATKVFIPEDHNLYAQWTANKYTVAFNVTDGNPLSESESTKEVTYDSPYGDLPKPKRTGYKFEGWFTDIEGGTMITSTTTVAITKDQTLYAHWKLGAFTVTFNATGGTSTLESKEVYFGEEYGDLPDANRTGYNFDGWYTEIEGETMITSTTKVEITENQTLYAHWTVNKYTVTFDAMGGVTNQTSKEVTFDKPYGDLPGVTRAGYTFDGWFTDSEGGDEIKEGMIVKIGNDHTLYAHWTANNYTVTFDARGGTTSKQSKEVTFDKPYGDLPNANKTGYTFDGWFTEKNEDITGESIVKTPDNHTLYAHWAVNKYIVTFNATGGVADQTSREVTFDSPYEDLPNAMRTGYTFVGWYTEITGGTIVREDTNVSIPENHNLYAHWRANKYIVTFDATGGVTNQTSKEVTFDRPYGDLPVPERSDHAFIGWYTEASFGQIITAEMEVKKAENHMLYARWGSEQSTSASLFIPIVAISAVAVLIIAIFLIIFGVLSKRRHEKYRLESERGYELSQPLIDEDDYSNEYSRVVSTSNDEAERNDALTGIDAGILSKLYTQDYARPKMKDALLQVDLIEPLADLICSACENAAHVVKEEGKLFDDLTEEDAAAIAMYTYDFGTRDFEKNPYRIVNRSLAGRNYANLQKVSGLLYLVMRALRKLPRYTGQTLYRGVRGEVSLDEDHYHEGNIITWTALSSTSPDMGATKAFLARGSRDKSARGTMFVIDGGWGYNIQPYSLFPGEIEILLEPERQFRVKSVFPGEELTFINLQMLDTPLALTHVFGEGREDD